MLDMVGGEYPRLKARAVKHGKWIRENFKNNLVHENFNYSLGIFNKLKKIEIKEVDGISFCISTNGLNKDKTYKTIASIKKSAKNINFSNFEIRIAGNIDNFLNIKDVKLIESRYEADNGLLSRLRNNCAENCIYENIVFLDDDIVLEDEWVENFINFSKKNAWEILGNKILLPNGDRYWDRATFIPHTMVDYDHSSCDTSLYQTGCFWVIRKYVFEKDKWNEKIGFYEERNGKINEDVEYSIRLIKKGYNLIFDKENTVWHLDGRYYQTFLPDGRDVCLKNEVESTFSIKDFSYLEKDET
jgi:hypothetical protein